MDILNSELASNVANELLRIKAVKLQPNDPFTWASGWNSRDYSKTDGVKCNCFCGFCNIILERSTPAAIYRPRTFKVIGPVGGDSSASGRQSNPAIRASLTYAKSLNTC